MLKYSIYFMVNCQRNTQLRLFKSYTQTEFHHCLILHKLFYQQFRVQNVSTTLDIETLDRIFAVQIW